MVPPRLAGSYRVSPAGRTGFPTRTAPRPTPPLASGDGAGSLPRMSRPLRLVVPLLVVTSSACSLLFDRGQDLGPGDVAARAVLPDTGAPIPFAKVVVEGAGQTRRATAGGDVHLVGLGAGPWVLRFLQDHDGDGVPE